MTKTLIETSGGLLIFYREGRKLVRVRFIDAAIADYYREN